MRTVKTHLRLARRFLVQALVRETHYRVHFLTTVAVGLAELVLALIPIWVLFGYADDVNGWSRAEVVALVGLFQLTTGVLAAVVAPNLTRMTTYLTRGELDLVLIRPVSAQFYLTFRWVRPAELGKAATGLVILVIGLMAAGATPGPAAVIQAALLVGCGLVLLTCVWSALAYLAFWSQSVEPIGMVFDNLVQAGQYPLAFFPSGVRAFLTFAFPVAFATTLPAQALAGHGAGWQAVGGGLGMCVAAVAALRAYWRFGLRSYASASS